jgi:hypothetical protein
MKALFLKLAHVKKRRTVKKAIGLGVAAWTFRFGAMNSDTLPTRVDSGHYTQRLLTQNSYKKTETDDQSVNSIRFKTGSGAVIEIQNQQNQTPEVLKSALEIRCGDLSKSGPGPKAKADARNAVNNRSPKSAKSKSGGSGFAEALSSNHSNRSRPAAANRLAQQFQTGPAKGGNGLFGRFTPQPTPDPHNPGCTGRPRSITVLSGQRNSDSSTKLIAYDGFEAKLTDKSENHLTSKHGHKFGVDDPLPRNPNSKPTKYEQTRTRLNHENKAKVREEIKSILSNTNSDIYTDVSIRGIQGRVYNCKDTNRVIGIHTEGEFAGQIMKAQPISDPQLDLLRELNILD